MHRRHLLQLLLAASAVGCSPKSVNSQEQIVIVGAGIIGASIAYHLSKAGHRVVILDKDTVPDGATARSFPYVHQAWLAPFTSHFSSLPNWQALSKLVDLKLHPTGALDWTEAKHTESHANLLDVAALTELEPEIDWSQVESAVMHPHDFVIDPLVATQALLKAAQKQGADIRRGTEALSFDGLSVVTNQGVINATHVVLATGATTGLAEKFEVPVIPQKSSPGLIARTTPLPRIFNHTLIAPDMSLYQQADGRVIIHDRLAPPESHADRLRAQPEIFPEANFVEMHSYMIWDRAIGIVPRIEDAEIESLAIGWRPRPVDGLPVLGATAKNPKVSYALTDHGITLAPLIGQLMAGLLSETVTKKGPNDLLQSFSPDRFS